MSRFGVLFLSCLWAGLLPQATLGAAEEAPDFGEVYSLISSNLPAGVTSGELNSLALKSLLSALDPRVALEDPANGSSTPGAEGKAQTGGSPVIRADMFQTMAYIRVGRVAAALPKTLADTFKGLAATNKIQGVVLDLRYCGGWDYQAAAATADLFVATNKALLDWGEGMAISKEAGALISVPAAVLVNGKTVGAAEALAAILRDTGTGLLLGSRTAGMAAAGREFVLSTGQRLRINVHPVRLGSGAAMPAGGLAPDISVEVSPDDERAYYIDAFAALSKTNGADAATGAAVSPSGTNRISRKFRLNEAELVREHNEGRTESARRPEAEPEQQTVGDPSLARALDLLKGLALVRQRN